MDIAIVRQRVLDMMARARAAARDRHARNDQAAADYARFLERIAVPLSRQLVNVLKAERRPFTLATPAGGIRLTTERSGGDFVEIVLDTAGERPLVLCRARRQAGGRVVETERAINEHGSVDALGEEDVLRVLLEELAPFVER